MTRVEFALALDSIFLRRAVGGANSDAYILSQDDVNNIFELKDKVYDEHERDERELVERIGTLGNELDRIKKGIQ